MASRESCDCTYWTVSALLTLQIANVSRIMKNSLPTTAKVSKEAKECVQECVSEFISFIVSRLEGRLIARYAVVRAQTSCATCPVTSSTPALLTRRHQKQQKSA